MGSTYSKKQHIHDAIHLSGVPVTSISSNNQSHTSTTTPNEPNHVFSAEFLTQMRQITTSIQLSDTYQNDTSNNYNTATNDIHIHETDETHNIDTKCDYQDENDTESISSHSTTVQNPISIPPPPPNTKHKYSVQISTNNTTKGNTLSFSPKAIHYIKYQLQQQSNKCFFIGNNSHGQFDTFSTKNILNLTSMDLPNNISINNIITVCNGTTRILYNNNKYMTLPNINMNKKHNRLKIEHIEIISNDWSCNSIPNNICELIVLFTDDIYDEMSMDMYAMHTKGMDLDIYDMDIQMISGGITSNQLFILNMDNQLYASNTNGNKMNKICYFENNNIYIKKIESTCYASIFLDNAGRLYNCDGIDKDGEDNIHIIDNIKVNVDNIVCGSDHTLAKCINGNVYSFGFNGSGQLGHNCKFAVYEPTLIKYLVENNIHINMIACGSYHNVIVDTNGQVYCFGLNSHYECGNGNTENVYIPQLNEILRDNIVVNVRCGYQHNMVCIDNGDYYLWGDNRWNQCLVYNKDSYVCIPTKYNCEADVYTRIFPGKIIDIYPGWNETRIVTT